jgi:hypothetical protein
MANEVDIRLRLTGGPQVVTGLESVAKSFSALRSAIAGSAVVLATLRFANFIGEAIEAADAAGKMAQKIGIDVEALSALQYAAKLSDLSNEQLQTSLKKLGEEMVKTGNASGDMLEELLRVADEFSNMQDGAFKTARAVQLFGRAGIEMIPLLNQGSAAIRAQMEEGRRFGIVISSEFAAQAQEFNDNLKRIQAAGEGLALTIANKLLPALIPITEAIIELINVGKPLLDLIAKWAEGFALFAQISLKAWSAILKEATGSLQGFLAVLASPVGTAVAATSQASIEVLQKLIDKLAEVKEGSAAKPGGELINEADTIKAAQLLQDLIQKFYQLTDARLADANAEMIRDSRERENIDKLMVAEETKNHLLETEQGLHDATMTEINAAAWRKEQDRILAEEKERKRILDMRLQGAQTALGNAAEASLMFGKKGFAAYKAFMTAQAIIGTYKSAVDAYSSMASIPYVGPALGVVAAAAAIAAGIANVAKIQSATPPGYAAGGYTGPGARGEVAGQVHRGEFVMSAPAVQRVGLPYLETLNEGGGGGGGPTTVQGHTMSANIVVLRDHSELREFLRSNDGQTQVLDIVRNNKLSLGIA